jgi:hypothetical protein
LGIGYWPIPNPQSPIPNPQSPIPNKFNFEDAQIKNLKKEYNKLKNSFQFNKKFNHYDEYNKDSQILDPSSAKANISSPRKSGAASIISKLASTRGSSCAMVELLPNIKIDDKKRKTTIARSNLASLKEKKFLTASQYPQVQKKFLLPVLNKMQTKLLLDKNINKKHPRVDNGVRVLAVHSRTDEDELFYDKSEESSIRRFNREVEWLDKLETRGDANSKSWIITGV